VDAFNYLVKELNAAKVKGEDQSTLADLGNIVQVYFSNGNAVESAITSIVSHGLGAPPSAVIFCGIDLSQSGSGLKYSGSFGVDFKNSETIDISITVPAFSVCVTNFLFLK
jgi:hypothetical protein